MQPDPGHRSGPPVAIFKQTLTLRLMTAVFLAPFGIWLTLFAGHTGLDILPVLGIFLLGLTAAAWLNGHLFQVTLYPDAIARTNMFGTKRVEFTERTRFFHKNVQEYVNGIAAGKHIYITVDDGRNRVALSSSVRDMASLQQLLMELELTRYYAKRLEDYRKGKRMVFGPVSLHQGKLLHRGKFLPLTDVAQMTIVSGYFRVKAKGKMFAYCHVPLAKIANMSTFFRLIEDQKDAPIPFPAANQESGAEPQTAPPPRNPSPPPRPEPAPSIPAAAATACPNCNKEMVKRRATSGEHAGKLFWVCPAFPGCRGVLPAAE
jgi:hypothetical protein